MVARPKKARGILFGFLDGDALLDKRVEADVFLLLDRMLLAAAATTRPPTSAGI